MNVPFKLSDLLAKFKAIQDPKKLRQTICDFLNNELSLAGTVLEVTDRQVEIKKHILWVKVHPAIRQRLFMKKEDILQKINKIGLEDKIIDIK